MSEKYPETGLGAKKGNNTPLFDIIFGLWVFKTSFGLSFYQNYMSNFGLISGSFWPFLEPKK